MSNANDIEFASLAQEMILEFGINVGWAQSSATTWSVGDSQPATGSSSVDATVLMSPMVFEKRSLGNFNMRQDGDSVAYVEPPKLLSSGTLFDPKPGAKLTFPGGISVALVAVNRIFSGEDAAIYELLLRG